MRIRFLASVVVAAAAVFVPAAAEAGDVSVDSPQFASPVQLSWTVTADVSEVLYRASAPCGVFPRGDAVPVTLVDPLAGSAEDPDALDGTWCYYVEDTNAVGPLVYGAGGIATVDLTAPVA